MPVDFTSIIPGRDAPKGREPNVSGDRYGKLTLVREIERSNGAIRQRMWETNCDCGTVGHHARLTNLRNGHTSSCGCVQKQAASSANLKHGLTAHPLYKTWTGMLHRCLSPDHKSFPMYGGRGIKVCERWKSVENFAADMGVPPDGKTLDRIDTNGDYEPSNCRWATPKEQQRNMRNNRLIGYMGRNICLKEAAEIAGLNYDMVVQRLNKYGWTVEQSLGLGFSNPIDKETVWSE